VNVSPLPTPSARRKPLPNKRSYEDRIEFEKFAAATWASLAKDARDMLAEETYSGTRQQLEAFIERALNRATKHYRLADAVRRRGHG